MFDNLDVYNLETGKTYDVNLTINNKNYLDGEITINNDNEYSTISFDEDRKEVKIKSIGLSVSYSDNQQHEASFFVKTNTLLNEVSSYERNNILYNEIPSESKADDIFYLKEFGNGFGDSNDYFRLYENSNADNLKRFIIYIPVT